MTGGQNDSNAITDDPFTLTGTYAAVLFKTGALGEVGDDEDTDDEAIVERAIAGLQGTNGRITLQIDLDNEKHRRAIAYMARGEV